MNNTENFCYKEEKPPCVTTKSTLFAASKDEWNKRRALVSP